MNWGNTYIWNIGLAGETRYGFPIYPQDYFNRDTFNPNLYNEINQCDETDLVFVPTRYLKDFIEQILPKIGVKINLLICDGDQSFGSQYSTLILNENIKHIFAQNNVTTNDKVTSIPIGVDFHTIAYRNGGWMEPETSVYNQNMLLDHISRNSKPTTSRIPRAFVDFQYSNTMRADQHRYLDFGFDRMDVFRTLKRNDVIDYTDFMKRSDLWKKKSEYAFSICPPGNGIDTHRLWEDLILGCIPIVFTSPLDKLYSDYPILIIDNWEELTQINLINLLQFWEEKFDRNTLTLGYWMNKINTKLLGEV